MNRSTKSPSPQPVRQQRIGKAKTLAARNHSLPKSKAKKGRTPPAKGKLASVIAMLRRPKGATIADLCKVTDWQAHSVRGALSGAIKKRLGLPVTSEKSDGTRVYRIAS
jgi:hypothetical protein